MSNEPVVSEISDQQGNRDTLAAWFKAHPYVEISADDLEAMIGRNFQQRISECRRDLKMTVQNVPKWGEDNSGRRKRLTGGYLYRPDGAPLGRSAETQVEAEWPTVHGRPFAEEFRLR